jgi:hypothetical protein
MTVLLLCDAGDLSARWIERGLQHRRVPVLHVTGTDLVGADRFGHSVGRDMPRLRIRLRDGRSFTYPGVAGVINRLTYLPEPGDARVPASDRQYAATELNAITLSWMSALASTVPFVDRPSPGWIGGEWRSPAEWALLVHAAGLVAAPVALPSLPNAFQPSPAPAEAATLGLMVADRAWVSGARTGYDRQTLREGLVRLARSADADTLGVGLDPQGRVIRVDQVPDVRPTGEAGLSRLAELVGYGGVDA